MGYRSIAVTVINSAGENLILVDHDLDHGEWKDKPETIIAGQNGYFKAESKDGSLKGVEGDVTWTGGVCAETFKIYFKKPQSDDPTVIKVTVPDGYTYVQTGDKGGHDSKIGITFQKK